MENFSTEEMHELAKLAADGLLMNWGILAGMSPDNAFYEQTRQEAESFTKLFKKLVETYDLHP